MWFFSGESIILNYFETSLLNSSALAVELCLSCTNPSSCWFVLTLKRLGHFFFQNIILFSNVVHYESNIVIWYRSSAMDIFRQCWGYWWPGALAPRHQYPQFWLCTRAFPAVYGLKCMNYISHYVSYHALTLKEYNWPLIGRCAAVFMNKC